MDVVIDVRSEHLQIEVISIVSIGNTFQLCEQIDFFVVIRFVEQSLSVLTGRHEAII